MACLGMHSILAWDPKAALAGFYQNLPGQGETRTVKMIVEVCHKRVP